MDFNQSLTFSTHITMVCLIYNFILLHKNNGSMIRLINKNVANDKEAQVLMYKPYKGIMKIRKKCFVRNKFEYSAMHLGLFTFYYVGLGSLYKGEIPRKNLHKTLNLSFI